MSYTTVTEVRLAASPGVPSPNPPDEPTGTAADLSNASLTDAIAEADATIDSYLAGRYDTPVGLVNDLTPHPIDWWSRNIALYLATLTYRGSQDFTDNDPVARRYEATMEALRGIQAGKASLPSSISESGSANGSGLREGAAPPFNQYPNAMFSQDQFEIEGAIQGPVTVSPFSPQWRDRWSG